MTSNEISVILAKLDRQNDEYKRTVKAHAEAVQKLSDEISDMKFQLQPIHELFENVSGFNKIAVWTMKGLLLFAAFIGAIYGFIVYLRN